MPTSFLSEHSVEYCIVNRIVQLLNDTWLTTPIYFWRTREGSLIAKKCSNEEVRMIAVYPRRPKIAAPDDKYILMKINEYIFYHANYLLSKGFAVFCAVPLISSILEYNIDTPCCWFSFIREIFSIDIEVLLDKNTGIADESTFQNYVMPIREDQIPFRVKESTHAMKLLEAIEIVSQRTKYGNATYNRYTSFGPYYKPIYFFLTERH